MVRSNEDNEQGWRTPNRGGLILLDEAGERQLRISPASAFQRPRLKQNVAPFAEAPPLAKALYVTPKPPIQLHDCLAISDWKGLRENLEELQTRNDAFDFHCSFAEENEDQETPLHTAAWKSPPALTLQMLATIPPPQRKKIILRKDYAGNTVLHLCCANVDARVEFTVIKNVLLLAPEALDMQNDGGDTPLHLLVCSPGFHKSFNFTVEIAAEEAITSLLSLVEEQGTRPNNLGLTLLHCAIAHGAHERVLVQLLRIVPQAASVPNVRGMLPLHFAAAFGGTPWTFVHQLIEVYPQGLLAPSEDGDTPLHSLVVNAEKQLNEAGLLDRNTTKIAELLLATPHGQRSAILVPNAENLAPLHCCAIFDAPPQLTRILMESDHAIAASAMATQSGWTALSLACASMERSTANVEALTTQTACKTFDDNDRTPLMVALENSSSPTRAIKFLVSACPRSVLLATQTGAYLPVHLALMNHAKESIVKILVKANKATLEVTDDAGNTGKYYWSRVSLDGVTHHARVSLNTLSSAATVSQRSTLPASKELRFPSSNTYCESARMCAR
jgi:ankyrin repeat protein